MPQLDDKIAVVTGAAQGIGRAIAETLARRGAHVVVADINLEKAQATAQALAASTGRRVIAVQTNVADSASAQAMIDRTLAELGRIDVLVNNAGYAVRGALEEVPDEQVQQMFDVNVFGVLRMIRAVAPHMRKQGTGRIVNISSIAGKLSTPVNGAYSATKFALEALSDALRLELAPFGIQVVVVEPGAVKTRFDDTAQAHAQGILSNSSSPYRPLYHKSGQFAASMRQQEFGPPVVSTVIQ